MSKSTRSRFVTASALALAAAVWSAPAAFGQAPPAGGTGGGTGGGNTEEQQRRQQFEQWRQQADTRMKELLKATDEEYAVLKPRIEQIQLLQRANDTRQYGMRMLFSGTNNWRTRGSNPGDSQRRPNDGGNATRRPTSPFGETPETPVSQKSQEMQAALEAKDAPADALKTKLSELRAARQQSRVEMAKMQEDLRQLCSIRQESVLVMMGILE